MIELVESFWVGDDVEIEFHKFETSAAAMNWLDEKEFVFKGITGDVWFYKKGGRMAALKYEEQK